MSKKRKPTRKDLLIIIGRCQTLFGRIGSAFSDQNPNRAADIDRLTREGHNLCVDATEYEDQVEDSGPWGTP